MAADTKQNIMTVVMSALLGIIGSMLIFGIHQLQGNINELSDNVEVVRTDINRYNVDMATIKATQFTISEGVAVWKEIAAMRELIVKLPPLKWRSRIEKTEMRVQRIETLMGIEKPKVQDRFGMVRYNDKTISIPTP